MHPDETCCLPAHDAEIEGYYLDLLEAGSDCDKEVTESKNTIRQIYCFGCAPNQYEYIDYVDGGNSTIRICKELADKIDLTSFDNCGMVVVEERGADCLGDDTVIPSLYWSSVSDFLNDDAGGKPPYFEGDFIVEIVENNEDCFNNANHNHFHLFSVLMMVLVFVPLFLFLPDLLL
eukprot:CAMPEP_0117754990 /NCGR_PEP_ID=MMETSP0947-20121206/13178_1 /TAXON_ID=44440 /ORGANISM="Chattonella subsalsa, Strain CCMP2191" /LENGTH=175 /DNA_ID=CAMNT_0005574225 /DNA_START=166 /DNA_END=693 /DNA_ORIENTATION=-